MTRTTITPAKTQARPAPKNALHLEQLTLWLAGIQLVCVIGFLIDLASEFPDPRFWGLLSTQGLVHLLSELAIMALLMIGFVLARRSHRILAAQRDALAGSLQSLRGDFDTILTRQFDAWGLTPAQRDVALLSLRGLRIAEIAAIRGCAEGTVKAHMSAVFRAANVRTRGELVGLFMEEFLDHGSTAAPAPGAAFAQDTAPGPAQTAL